MDSPLSDSQLLLLIKEYSEQLKHDPNADVFCQLANAYVRLGVVDAALVVLQQGLVGNPQHLPGQLLLAELQGNNKQYDEAVAGYEKVLQQHPDCVDALIGIAQLNLDQANFDRAQLYLERARLLKPERLDIKELIAQCNKSVRGDESCATMPLVSATIAELYFKQGLREKAVDVYKILVRQQPQNEILQARLDELLDKAESIPCTSGGSISGKLENWLGAIQRRRKNV